MTTQTTDRPERQTSWQGPRLLLGTRVDPLTAAQIKDRAQHAGLSVSDWLASAARQALRT